MRNLLIAVLSALLLPLGSAFAQDPALTEDWSFKPPVVTPGKNQKPPSDAIVLFYRGRDLANWEGREGDPQWKTLLSPHDCQWNRRYPYQRIIWRLPATHRIPLPAPRGE